MMIKYLFNSLITVFAFTLFVSCNKPNCENLNPIFEKYSPESKEYKNELVKRLKQMGPTKISYWLDKYVEGDSLQYLRLFVQGDGFCAKAILTVKNWDRKLEGIHQTKGVGYSGAKLKNLKYDLYQDSNSTEMIYHSVESIID